MAIYTSSKPTIGDQYPQGKIDTVWQRVEPLITPQQVVEGFLFGIPLVSGMKDPITGRAARITPEMLQGYINDAVSKVETACHIELMPTQIEEKHPYDPQEFKSLGYMRLKHRPVASVEAIRVMTADNHPIFTFDLNWVDPGHLHQGQLNILPFLLSVTGTPQSPAVFTGGTAQSYLALFNGGQWVPSLIEVTYTTGFKDGQMPSPINQLIGNIVAIRALSMLGATYARSQSTSLAIDGLSQSVSTPGPNVYAVRIKDLCDERDMQIAKTKAALGQRLFSGNV